jgi:anti-anti-sigma factor
MSTGSFLVGISQKTLMIALGGEITMKNVSPLKEFIRHLELEQYTTIIINLQHTRYLDSTSFGVIASLAVQFYKKYNRKIWLINLSVDIQEQVIQFGFLQIAEIQSLDGIDMDQLKLMPLEGGHEIIDGRDILEAHRSLIELNQKNKEIFQRVIELLSGEIENPNHGK